MNEEEKEKTPAQELTEENKEIKEVSKKEPKKDHIGAQFGYMDMDEFHRKMSDKEDMVIPGSIH